MNTYQDTGLAQYYGGTIDGKSKTKKNMSNKSTKKRKKKCK